MRMIVGLSTLFSLLSTVKKAFKLFRNNDGGGPKSHQKNRGKDEKDQGKDQFDSGLGSLFLYFLAALDAQGVGMNAQRLGDAGAELFRLHQDGNEIAHAVYASTFGQVFPGLGPGAPGTLFQYHDSQLIADFGLCPA